MGEDLCLALGCVSLLHILTSWSSQPGLSQHPPIPSTLPQLLAWPEDVPEAVTVVAVAPDLHGPHHGYITQLRKFTAYLTSALCFTTPGDGPPSPPQLVRTHEDSELSLAGRGSQIGGHGGEGARSMETHFSKLIPKEPRGWTQEGTHRGSRTAFLGKL